MFQNIKIIAWNFLLLLKNEKKRWIFLDCCLDSTLYSLAFWTSPRDVDSWCRSLSTQHDQIIPPEHESIGFPPAKTHDILSPHSKRRPLYLHVCGITAKKKQKKNKRFKLQSIRKCYLLFLSLIHSEWHRQTMQLNNTKVNEKTKSYA